MTEEDKRMNEAFIKQIESFKKLEKLYKPLSFKRIHYLKQLKEYIILSNIKKIWYKRKSLFKSI
jgi:hypothetical protein